MSDLEFTTTKSLLELLDISKAEHNCVENPIRDEFKAEFYKVIEGKNKAEQAEALYKLYQEYLDKYDNSSKSADLLEAGTALFNSATRLNTELDDSLSLKKRRLEEVVNLTQHESVKEEGYFPVLRIKALLEEVATLITHDHNFIKAFSNLKEIQEISNSCGDILGEDFFLWNIFIINALEVYRVQAKPEEYETLISEVTDNFDKIDLHLRWDVILKLMFFSNLSEDEFDKFSQYRCSYFEELMVKSNDKEREDLKDHDLRTKRYMLGERLKALASDPKRDESQFERLKGFFEEDFAEEDKNGQEYLAEIQCIQGLADDDIDLLEQGISRYAKLQIEFHHVEYCLKKHLKFTDLQSPEGREEAKQDLFKSLAIIEKNLREIPIAIFTEVINDPRLCADRICTDVKNTVDDTKIEDNYMDRVEEILKDHHQTEYLKDVIRLILSLYNNPENLLSDMSAQPKDTLKNWVDRKKKFYLQGQEFEIDDKNERPVFVVLGTGHVVSHMVNEIIKKNMSQTMIQFGRKSKPEVQEIYSRVLGGVDGEQYMKNGNIVYVNGLEFSQPQLGINDQTTSTLKEISQQVKLVIVNGVADVKFLNPNDPVQIIQSLFETNTDGVIELDRLFKSFDKKTLLVHIGTWFMNEGNQLYEFSKLLSHKYLQQRGGNILEIIPPVVGGQSADGAKPYSTLNSDGAYMVVRRLARALKKLKESDDPLEIDIRPNVPLHMVTVDKLAAHFINLIKERLDNNQTDFEAIDCIAGDKCVITPQDVLEVIITVFNILQESDLSLNTIKAGNKNIGFDLEDKITLNRFMPFGHENPRRGKSDEGTPEIGITLETYFMQILWFMLRGGKPNKKEAIKKYKKCMNMIVKAVQTKYPEIKDKEINNLFN